MSIEGWYYLHTNGDLIYKCDLDGTVADIRESDFARALWPMDTGNRLGAWNILIEGLAAGANLHRVNDLATKWSCDNQDAQVYADCAGALVYMDGDKWCATYKDFENLQESPAGFGDTALAAMADLAKNLGYQPSKMWGNSFLGLLKAKTATPATGGAA